MPGWALLGAAMAADVPFERLPSGHLVVETAVDAAPPAPYVLDTGASVTVIDARAWAAAGRGADEGRRVAVRAAGGKVAGRLVGPVRVTVGDVSAELTRVVVLPLDHLQQGGEPLAGILGKDFLKRHVVSLDFATSTLGLHAPNAPLDVSGYAALPTRRLRAGLLGVDLVVGGAAVPAIVDLGASYTILNDPAATLPGVTLSEAATAAAGADAQALALREARVGALRLGTLDHGETTVFAADLPVFATMRMHREPGAILGTDVLARYRVVIDYGGGVLYLRPLAD